MPTIQEIAQISGFKGGGGGVRSAEVQTKRDLPVINNSGVGTSVSTSLDCYVAGEYIGKGGSRLQVTQRYTLFVSYSSGTQVSTMEQARVRIMSDFQQRFNQFNVTTVYVPQLIEPQQAPSAEAEQFYRGSEEWRVRIQRASFDIGTEKEKASRNITNIRRRYNL